MMIVSPSAIRRTLALPQAANTPEAYPHDRVLQPGKSLASLWADTGLIRSDITPGFNGMTGDAVGVPLGLHLHFRSASDGLHALARHAVYVWHADAAGDYSIFNRPETNYLRGIGVTDAGGRVGFQTIYPGTYRGRPPHIHFEVYRSLDSLRRGITPLIRSSILFPDMISRSVYSGYRAYTDSLKKYDALRFEPPIRESTCDKRALQLSTVSGSGDSTLRASLNVFLQ
jgi:Dioxygenase